jgi:hypothetical protein
MSEHVWDAEGTESIASVVRRHDKDLYRGNGKPGLTTRMARQEDAMDAACERLDKSDKRQDRTQSMFWAIILLLLTILGGVITDTVKARGDSQPATTRMY